MKKPDEIMAEYLLKGGKMLAKTCPACSCPLFEIKGETMCIVCREEAQENERIEEKKTQENLDITSKNQKKPPAICNQGTLDEVFVNTIKILLERVQTEQDASRLNTLIQAVKTASEAYALVLYGYDNRDNS
jgi:UPF0148 protein